MFLSQSIALDNIDYDFNKSDNSQRWRGLFAPSLQKVLEHVHPNMAAGEEALLYVETLCIRILSILCDKPSPHSIQDVEEKIKRSFPAPIDCWALNEAKEAINCKKKKLFLPVERVHSLLQKDVLLYKIDNSVTVFIVAVLEYVSADILKLAGNYVRKIKHFEIKKEDIEVAMCADKVLMDMFYQNHLKNVLSSPVPTCYAQRSHITYEDVVKELIHDEKQYQRDLNMIIRVFRPELLKIVDDSRDLETIFSNIFDIYELTVTLLSSLEDVIEMSQEQSIPCVGNCFEELAEAEEFHVYTKFAQEITSFQSREALKTVIQKLDVLPYSTAHIGLRDAFKYYMPKLLFVPLWHAFVYFDYIKLLIRLSPLQDDIESFKQVQGLLRPLRCDLEFITSNLPNEVDVPLSRRLRRQMAIEKTKELQHSVESWDKDIGQNCNEFIREGLLGKIGPGKRLAERKVYLFDSLMLLCKPNIRKPINASGGISYDFRLKEKIFMRRVEIHDREDTDEIKYSFEIFPRVQPAIILTAKNLQQKNDWMADLIMIYTKPMLDRLLDSVLLDIEKKHPLRLPNPEMYKFAIPDGPNNIILEENEIVGVPLIKGATLCKLIERLTYHIYADPMFVRSFLITYRYFCSPIELLNLLIERFNIPEPNLVYQENQHNFDNSHISTDADKVHKNSQREDWKRYRKEYVQPVQFRVLNVLRHWVDHHFYDFEKEPFLLEKLLQFLENINGKSMRKWVDSVLKIVQRKNEQDKFPKLITFAYGHFPPPIEYHLNISDEETNLLTLHPLELARQLTLLEFALYKNVKPAELVGSPWTKKDKDSKSPNLLKIMKHTTNVTRWIEKSIIESENYEERVAMVTRAIEVMMVMLELNNFNGILSISAAMSSASVYRLKLTFQGLPARYEKFLEECRELSDGHLKKYQEKLRSINPPCVPFFGRYLTNILHLEEGNPDFLSNSKLINFSKRRKVSEIIGEIQQYQNQPYCLMVDAKIRDFLEKLDPFKGMPDNEISNFLYHESLRIEPRGCKQAPKFPRKWPTISLKSPGIKPRRQHNSGNPSGTKSTNQLYYDSEQSPIDAIQSRNVTHNSQSHSIFANVNIPERLGNNMEKPKADIGNIEEKPNLTYGIRSASTCSTLINTENKCTSSENIYNSSKQGVNALLSPQENDLNTRIFNNEEKINSSQLNEGEVWVTSLKELRNIEPYNNNNVSFQNCSHNLNFSKIENFKSHYEDKFADKLLLCNPNIFLKNYDNDGSNFRAPENNLSCVFYSQSTVSNPKVTPTRLKSQFQNSENGSFVPPLPPRRKENMDISESSGHKNKVMDAPRIPPRDNEISPPPIPPRIKSSEKKYTKMEYVRNNTIILPNVDNIMMRNSAIEQNIISAIPVPSIMTKLPLRIDTLQLSNPIQKDNIGISPVLSSAAASPISPLISSSINIPTVCTESGLYSSIKTQDSKQNNWGLCETFFSETNYSAQLTGNVSSKFELIENNEKETLFLYPSTKQK